MAALLGHIRAAGRRVAVIALTPRARSSGAVLGDRIRMMIAMRTTGSSSGAWRVAAARGIAWATASLVHLLDALATR